MVVKKYRLLRREGDSDQERIDWTEAVTVYADRSIDYGFSKINPDIKGSDRINHLLKLRGWQTDNNQALKENINYADFIHAVVFSRYFRNYCSEKAIIENMNADEFVERVSNTAAHTTSGLAINLEEIDLDQIVERLATLGFYQIKHEDDFE